MKKVRKLAGLLLALVMVLSLNITALADDDPVTGTITITNATIGQSYHIFKLFDATVSSEGVNYIATSSQKTALEAVDDNVFAFTQITEDTYSVTYEDEGMTVTKTVTESEMADLLDSGINFNDDPELVEEGTYYVKVGTNPDTQTTYTTAEVISFISSYVLKLSDSLFMCYFPGAEEQKAGTQNIINGKTVTVEVDGMTNGLADQSTVTFSELPLGYYFVTSSLGSVVSLNTTRTEVEIEDKNDGTPDWDNNPADPDDPVKVVLDDGGKDINELEVAPGDMLTYQISYKNQSSVTLTDVILTDDIPENSEYKDDSITIWFVDDEDNKIEVSNYFAEGIGTVTYAESSGTLTWTIATLPADYTLIAEFKVTASDTTEKVVIENEADLTVKLGENKYDLKTNQVENPVYPEDNPEKSVQNANGEDINLEAVKVGDILTYVISYTSTEDTDTVVLTINDAPPTGTVYVADSATGTIEEPGGKPEAIDNSCIEINSDGTITWTISLPAGATAEVSFQVVVTKAAYTIIDSTITNTASGKIGDNNFTTNTVKNPAPEDPEDPDPTENGKVIINADGSKSKVSTGSYGDTVTFDVSIDAVNTVANKYGTDSDNNGEADPVKVTAYYIYDLLGAGFDLNDLTDSNTVSLKIGSDSYKIVASGTNSTSGAACYSIQDNSGNEIGTLFTYKNGTDTQDDTSDDTTLIAVKIPWVETTVDQEGNTTVTSLYENCEVHLIYTATINTNAEIGDNGNKNKAIFDYSTVEDTNPIEPDPGDPKYPSSDSDTNHEYNEVETTTYTYALGIQKVSQESGVALEGAVFTLVDAGGNQIYALPVTDNDNNVKYYNYTSDPTESGATKEFTTNSEGRIIIKGVDIGTYSFTETKAPSGYSLLGSSVSVTATMDSSYTTQTFISSSVTRYFESVAEDEWADIVNVYTKDTSNNRFTLVSKPNDYSEEYYKLVSSSGEGITQGSLYFSEVFDVAVTAVLVENSSGSLLPSTGGIGTTIFYIVGGLLVFGAAVVLITRRRMNAR